MTVMRRKYYLWISSFIVLIIVTFTFLLIWNIDTEPEIIYKDIEPSKYMMNKMRIVSLKNNPPPNEQGYKWVWHHNHWNKVKIDNSAAVEKSKFTDQNLSADVESYQHDTPIRNLVAVSDDVPKYSELKSMSDDELSSLYNNHIDKYKTLSEQLIPSVNAWVNAKPGSAEKKALRAAMENIEWQYAVHDITSKRAYQVHMNRLIRRNFNRPHGSGEMVIYPGRELTD